MKTVQVIFDELAHAQESGQWSRFVRLCREGLSLTGVSQPDDWYGLAINLARGLRNEAEQKPNLLRPNMEEAIAICHRLLEILARDREPKKWAATHRNLGYLLSIRTDTDMRHNVELVLQHYKEALKVFTKKRYPYDWAIIKAGMGLAYSKRRVGDHKKNLANAVKCYRDTLIVFTKDRYRDDHEDSIREIQLLEKRLHSCQ